MQIALPRDVQFIFKNIRDHGGEAFAVGGCVRDNLMGKTPRDWDITTSIAPLAVKKIFPRTFDTGIAHGTVTVVLNRINYEVTTFRTDGKYTDGRRPDSVAFSENIEDDLSRRDFTINAMAYNDRRGLIDLFGGLKDLENGLIRAVGEPEKRFTEDALRMLRAVRFAAQLGFEIEPETFRAVCELADRLELISAERIREELLALLMSPHPQTGTFLETAGIMPHVLRGRKYGGDLQNALGNISACPKNPAMVIALFLSWAGDSCAEIMKDLRFDNKTVSAASTYVRWLPERIRPERSEIKKIMAAMTAEYFFNLLTLKKISAPEKFSEIDEAERTAREILEKGECVYLRDLKITGDDLIRAGVPKGKPVGEALKLLLDEIHKRPELNEREELLKLIKQSV